MHSHIRDPTLDLYVSSLTVSSPLMIFLSTRPGVSMVLEGSFVSLNVAASFFVKVCIDSCIVPSFFRVMSSPRKSLGVSNVFVIASANTVLL